jgi:hypothetical protein
MRGLRGAILAGRFDAHAATLEAGWATGDAAPEEAT